MKKYEALTKYVDILFNPKKSLKPKPEKKPLFPWGKKMERYERLRDINPGRRYVIESKSAGACYVRAVYDFIADTCDFALANGYAQYENILKENGVDYSAASIRKIDLSSIKTDALVALLVFATRAERFFEGYLEPLLVDGSIKSWLTELKRRDEICVLSLTENTQ